jgi:nucleoside phosphorylase
MKLGILAAVGAELRPTLRVLRPASRRLDGRAYYESGPFLFAVGGIGSAHAADAAAWMAERFRPDALVSTGYAGALTGDLRTGDLILGGSSGFPPASALLETARQAAPDARVAEILAVDRVLQDGMEKSRMADAGAVAADMESAAVGEVARQRGLGFLCVKVVLDTPAEPLASTYEGVLEVLSEMLRRPRLLFGIAADAARARQAAARLAAFYGAFAPFLNELP